MKMNGNWKGAGNVHRIKCNNATNGSKILDAHKKETRKKYKMNLSSKLNLLANGRNSYFWLNPCSLSAWT